MGLPVSNPPPSTLPYGHASSAPSGKEVLTRTFGLMVGVILGTVAGILTGLLAWWVILLFTKTQSDANIASKGVGVCFFIAAIACGFSVNKMRSLKSWLGQGFLVAAGMFFLLFALIFLLYQSE